MEMKYGVGIPLITTAHLIMIILLEHGQLHLMMGGLIGHMPMHFGFLNKKMQYIFQYDIYQELQKLIILQVQLYGIWGLQCHQEMLIVGRD